MSNAVTTVSQPVRHPFGLPMGSVRGMLSVLICAFFWLTILWPGELPVRALLGHYFMLALVVMAFASAPVMGDRERQSSPFLPWVLRLIFVGGSAAVVIYAVLKDFNQLQLRLTPDEQEVKQWWIPFLASMVGGFSLGLFLRFAMGRENHVFRTMQSWLSMLGMLMLVVELVFFIGFASAESKPAEFFRIWQCIEMVIVSAYFGTRA